MTKLKEQDPLIGTVVDYYGEDHRVIASTIRKGRKLYIGHKVGHFHTYYIDPAKINFYNEIF